MTGIGICRFEGQLVAGDFSVLEFNGPIVRYELASNLAFLRCDIEGGLNRVAVKFTDADGQDRSLEWKAKR